MVGHLALFQTRHWFRQCCFHILENNTMFQDRYINHSFDTFQSYRPMNSFCLCLYFKLGWESSKTMKNDNSFNTTVIQKYKCSNITNVSHLLVSRCLCFWQSICHKLEKLSKVDIAWKSGPHMDLDEHTHTHFIQPEPNEIIRLICQSPALSHHRKGWQMEKRVKRK